MAKRRKFNVFMYYLHRYIRLTPAYGALLLFTIYLIPKMSSGALWQPAFNNQSTSCKQDWLPMILYGYNFYYVQGMTCLVHTWYLAMDMQLFWVSPFILYPLYKKPKLGLIILSAAIVASVITPATVVMVNKFSTMISKEQYTDIRMMLKYYVVPYCRAGPWLLGILTGYLIASGSKPPSSGVRIIGWILTFLAFTYGYFTFRIYQQEDYKWNMYWEMFHGGLGRHIWAFGVCWIIFMSALGHGGIVTKFLSHPIYLPFSRVSYSIYLLHLIIQSIRVYSMRTPIYFSEYQMIIIIIIDVITSFLAAIIFSLVFESPFVILEKLIFSREKPIDRPPEPIQEEITSENGIINHGFGKQVD
ncbi:GSCOCG00013582001-RA-CDS [Cotesia congregata]|nr:GSCOCG00013582001-RA-CDS [Cotesia congregata]